MNQCQCCASGGCDSCKSSTTNSTFGGGMMISPEEAQRARQYEHLDMEKVYIPNEEKMGGFDVLYLPKLAYQKSANLYRRNFCHGKARPLELGEIHPQCQNWTGPGTRIDLHPNTPPYNNIDACSKKHDFDYDAASKQSDPKQKANLIRLADIEATKCYRKHPNEESYTLASQGINNKMRLENALPKVVKSIAPNYSGKGILHGGYLNPNDPTDVNRNRFQDLGMIVANFLGNPAELNNFIDNVTDEAEDLAEHGNVSEAIDIYLAATERLNELVQQHNIPLNAPTNLPNEQNVPIVLLDPNNPLEEFEAEGGNVFTIGPIPGRLSKYPDQTSNEFEDSLPKGDPLMKNGLGGRDGIGGPFYVDQTQLIKGGNVFTIGPIPGKLSKYPDQTSNDPLMKNGLGGRHGIGGPFYVDQTQLIKAGKKQKKVKAPATRRGH